MTKRVLLTGCAGFIGSHVVRYFAENTDWHLVLLVTFRHKGKADRLNVALEDVDPSRYTVITHDLFGPISVQTDAAIGHIDYVFSLASDSHVDRSLIEPVEFMQRNVAIITNLAEWARHRDIQAFVHLSTDEVYGPAREGQAHREWLDPIKPSNAYSASKAAQEAYLFSCWRAYDLPVIMLNLMNQVGEMQDGEKFVPKVLKAVTDGSELEIHASPDGKIGTRMYMHTECLASAMLFVTERFGDSDEGLNWATFLADEMHTTRETLRYSQGGEMHYRFHVAGTEISNLDLAQMIAKYAGKPLNYRLVDAQTSRPGHDLRYALDDSKIRELGWIPPLTLEQSVERTVTWTLEHPEWLL